MMRIASSLDSLGWSCVHVHIQTDSRRRCIRYAQYIEPPSDHHLSIIKVCSKAARAELFVLATGSPFFVLMRIDGLKRRTNDWRHPRATHSIFIAFPLPTFSFRVPSFHLKWLPCLSIHNNIINKKYIFFLPPVNSRMKHRRSTRVCRTCRSMLPIHHRWSLSLVCIFKKYIWCTLCSGCKNLSRSRSLPFFLF